MKYTFKPWHLLIYIWIILNTILYFKGYNSFILCEQDTDLIILLKVVNICFSLLMVYGIVYFLVESDYIIDIQLWKTKEEKEAERKKNLSRKYIKRY